MDRTNFCTFDSSNESQYLILSYIIVTEFHAAIKNNVVFQSSVKSSTINLQVYT